MAADSQHTPTPYRRRTRSKQPGLVVQIVLPAFFSTPLCALSQPFRWTPLSQAQAICMIKRPKSPSEGIKMMDLYSLQHIRRTASTTTPHISNSKTNHTRTSRRSSNTIFYHNMPNLCSIQRLHHYQRQRSDNNNSKSKWILQLLHKRKEKANGYGP